MHGLWAVFTYTLGRRNLIIAEADKEMQDDVVLRNRCREVVRMEVTIVNSGRRTQVEWMQDTWDASSERRMDEVFGAVTT